MTDWNLYPDQLVQPQVNAGPLDLSWSPSTTKLHLLTHRKIDFSVRKIHWQNIIAISLYHQVFSTLRQRLKPETELASEYPANVSGDELW